MMRKKLLAILLLCAMIMCTLTACQEKEGVVSGSNEEQNMQGDTKVKLTLWGAEEDGALLSELVESFKKEYSTETEFDITISYQGESQCKDNLFGNVEGGPDVFTFADDQLRVMVAAGVLSPVINADEVKRANIDAANDAASVNETLYAYPMTADNGYFLYYNKEYISDSDAKTMDSLLQAAAAAGKKVTMEWTSGWYLYSFFGGTGMKLGLNNDGVSNYCDWNTTEGSIKGTDVAEALLRIASNPGFASRTDTEFVAGVQDGSVAAGVSGVWNDNVVKEAWGDNYGATKLPTYTCAGQQVQMASFAGYKMLGVNAYSDEPEWAHKLAEWITNEKNQTLRFVRRGQGPSNKNASASSEVSKSPAIQAILHQSEYASLQRVGGNFWTPVQEFGKAMAAGNPEGKDLQEMLDTMVKGITTSYN